MNRVIAVFCADIHLSHKPPVARSAEPDWYEAMCRPLRQLRAIAEEHNAPIICAGDVFDKWNSPPELINFAIRQLPNMYAIPGQHDLPYHGYEEMRKSAYGVLAQIGIIRNIDSTRHTRFTNLAISGFPWRKELKPRSERAGGISIALIHQYCWISGHSYPNAPPVQAAFLHSKNLQGYDIAVFGDNHKGFIVSKDPLIYNCGALIRRRIDERDYQPMVGLLREDGTVVQHELDCSEDKWIDPNEGIELAERVLDSSGFLEELSTLDRESLNFEEMVKRYCNQNKIEPKVRSEIMCALEYNR